MHSVSNGEYALFLAATGQAPPQHWNEGKFPEHLADHPVIFVNWKDAAAYAEWAGKALPTAQQWEKAARGARGNFYPWSDQLTPAKCNVRENGVGSTTVGRYQNGVSPYGVCDMCGNVWERRSTESRLGRQELKGGAWTSLFDRSTPSSHSTTPPRSCATTTLDSNARSRLTHLLSERPELLGQAEWHQRWTKHAASIAIRTH